MAYHPHQAIPPTASYALSQQQAPANPAPAPMGFTQYSPHPIVLTRRSGFDFGRFWRSLGRLGQVCTLAGLVLFGSFFFSWFAVSLDCRGAQCADSPITQQVNESFLDNAPSASGFTIAGGALTYQSADDLAPGGNQQGNIAMLEETFSFPLLWLAVLASLALIALPTLMARGRVVARRGQTLIVLAADVALVVEVIYAVSVFGALPFSKENASALNALVAVINAQQSGAHFEATYHLRTNLDAGFWLGLLATLIAGVFSLFALRSASTAASPGANAQPGQAPGAQPVPYQQSGWLP